MYKISRRYAYFALKRGFDIFISVVGLIISMPIWIITIIGIKISDPGPIFYKAIRLGKGNREFNMWKFRSMRIPKNDEEKSEMSFKADEDRIFPVGKLIRKLKIDELPQLINVLCNTMSIVGPRPVARDQAYIMHEGKYAAASLVKPGLTGPAALFDYIYGDEVENLEDYKRTVLPTRLNLELYYPMKMSLLLDARIILYTAVCICGEIINRKPVKIYHKLQKWAEVANQTEIEPARKEKDYINV